MNWAQSATIAQIMRLQDECPSLEANDRPAAIAKYRIIEKLCDEALDELTANFFINVRAQALRRIEFLSTEAAFQGGLRTK